MLEEQLNLMTAHLTKRKPLHDKICYIRMPKELRSYYLVLLIMMHTTDVPYQIVDQVLYIMEFGVTWSPHTGDLSIES